MNKLPLSKRTQIINLLVEGNSMRATARITETSLNTVTKLLVEVGKAAQEFHNATVNNLQTVRVEADEIWSFVYAKEKNVPSEMKTEAKSVGDVWTWTAIDANSKLMISWLVADHGVESAISFVQDIRARVANRIQLSTDGQKMYLNAVEAVFDNQIDFAQIVKIFGGGINPDNYPDTKYSTPECTGTKKTVVSGNPSRKHISTSYVERQNLTMRMHMRRFTRLTNGFSKKMENHCYAVALHFLYYNFVKVHKTLRVTPAMEAGLADRPMTIEQIILLTEKKGAE